MQILLGAYECQRIRYRWSWMCKSLDVCARWPVRLCVQHKTIDHFVLVYFNSRTFQEANSGDYLSDMRHGRHEARSQFDTDLQHPMRARPPSTFEHSQWHTFIRLPNWANQSKQALTKPRSVVLPVNRFELMCIMPTLPFTPSNTPNTECVCESCRICCIEEQAVNWGNAALAVQKT